MTLTKEQLLQFVGQVVEELKTGEHKVDYPSKCEGHPFPMRGKTKLMMADMLLVEGTSEDRQLYLNALLGVLVHELFGCRGVDEFLDRLRPETLSSPQLVVLTHMLLAVAASTWNWDVPAVTDERILSSLMKVAQVTRPAR